MWIELNFKAGKPPYLQIVDQVKYQVASGAFRAGEALPSIRSLAESLELNRNTVAKAYAELEHEGVIETRQGKGAFVSAEPSPFGTRAKNGISHRGRRRRDRAGPPLPGIAGGLSRADRGTTRRVREKERSER